MTSIASWHKLSNISHKAASRAPFPRVGEGPGIGADSKELYEDHGLDWYDYGARFYDAELGRFTGLDPIADSFVFVTPYNYAENSPIANVDLWGLQAVNYNAMLALSDPVGFSKMIDQRNGAIQETMKDVDVNFSITAGAQVGGTFAEYGFYLNIANVELGSISIEGGQDMMIDHFGKDGNSKVSQSLSIIAATVEHSFDAYMNKSENSEFSFSGNILGANYEIYNNSEDDKRGSNRKFIDIDMSFLLGVHLDISIDTENNDTE